MNPTSNTDESGPVELPPSRELDLHSFRPQDVKEVVLSYLEACREKGILEVRVIHGRGIGQLRQTVQAALAKMPFVASFSTAGAHYGGEGATMVRLRPLPGEPPEPPSSPGSGREKG